MTEEVWIISLAIIPHGKLKYLSEMSLPQNYFVVLII